MLLFNATGPIPWSIFTEAAPVVTHFRVDVSPAGIVEGMASKLTILGDSEFAAEGLDVPDCCALLEGTVTGGAVT
jgi:hypothetical protein